MDVFRREDVVGKTVIDTAGAVRGKVKEVSFRLNGLVSLTVEGKDGRTIEVPLASVTGISEHVVVKNLCKYCGSPLVEGNMWCPSCKKAQS